MSKDDKLCGTCALFRKSDGFCRKKADYVNALAVEECYSDAALILVETKKCTDCGRVLPLENFGQTKYGTPKRICKECQGKRIQARRGKGRKEKPLVSVKPDAKMRRAESIARKEATDTKMADAQMVALLREHGWTVT